MLSTEQHIGAGALRPLTPWTWMVEGRDGSRIFCESRANWIAEWRRRVRFMESTDRPAEARRAGLEYALAVSVSGCLSPGGSANPGSALSA